MHDGVTAFRLELTGCLTEDGAGELAQAWNTASSMIGDRRLIIDLTSVTLVDAVGHDLILEWHNRGAQLIGASPRAKALIESITGDPVALPAAAPEHHTWLPLRTTAATLVTLVMLLFPEAASAASLKPEALKAWEEYVQSATIRMHERLEPGGRYLWVDEEPARLAKVQGGEVVVLPAGPHIPKKVSAGLIHDWMGAAFIPKATLDDVLPVVRDYTRYQEYYAPVVVRSKAIATGESGDRFSILLVNKPLLSKTALDGDYQSSFYRVSEHRWYSIVQTTRLQEIAGYGAANEHLLAEDEGNGLIWRLYSVARFEERDGGVYFEIEAMALSRDIPVALRLVVEPVVRRVSRGSLVTSLRQTQDAVRSSPSVANRVPVSAPDPQAFRLVR